MDMNDDISKMIAGMDQFTELMSDTAIPMIARYYEEMLKATRNTELSILLTKEFHNIWWNKMLPENIGQK